MIGEFGRTITLRQRVAVVADANVPSSVTMTDTDHAVTGVVSDFKDAQVDGEQIKAGDRKVLLAAADLTVVPAPGDQLIDGSTTLQVLDSKRIKPGGTDILYTIQARA